MGLYYQKKDRPEIAIQYFELAHELKPDNEPIFIKLKILRSYMKELPKEMKRKIPNIAGNLVDV